MKTKFLFFGQSFKHILTIILKMTRFHLALLFVTIALLFSFTWATVPRPFSLELKRQLFMKMKSIQSKRLPVGVPPYSTKWVNVPIDHFSFPQNSKTFRLRYLLNDESFKATGPIFFYTGNEGSIEDFYKNTGAVFNFAKKFNKLNICFLSKLPRILAQIFK